MIRRLIICAVPVVALVLYLLLRTTNRPDFERPDLARIRNAAAIGGALSKFQFEHNGRLPSRLSELVPNYVSFEKIRYFFPPGFNGTGGTDLSVSSNLSSQIDEAGAYVYLGERGLQKDLVLYERPSLWSLSQGKTNVMTVSSNFTRIQRSWEDVEARVKSLQRPAK